MRRIGLALTLLGVLAPLAAATTCAPSTLDVYISLGAGGCDIGSLNLSNFNLSVLSASGGADPIAPIDISVTPSFTPAQFKVNFASAGFSVVGTQAVKYLIEYTID